MPFIPRTPESLIPRSDSRNPATTCKGITSSGRPCRRSIASARPKHDSSSIDDGGVLAVLPHVNDSDEGAAAYFCWQHKDQAATLVDTQAQSAIFSLQQKTSIDSLVERVGVLDIQDRSQRRRRQTPKDNSHVVRRETLPSEWQKVQGPLMAVPEEPFTPSKARPRPQPRSQARLQEPRSRSKGDVHFSFFCCMGSADVDSEMAPRPRPSRLPEMRQSGSLTHDSHTQPQLQFQTHPKTRRRQSQGQGPGAFEPSYPVRKRSTSQTAALLSLIPSALPPTTTSQLLLELAKPLSPLDKEPGYIYIFHLTTILPPSSASPPSLNLPSRGPAGAQPSPSPAPVMLKIGRASNVQRRMNEWSRQCGYSLSLIRFYPHVRSSSTSHTPHISPLPSPKAPASVRQQSRRQTPAEDWEAEQDPNKAMMDSTPRKLPNIHRVERLIHLELADKRVKRACDGCGKEHREWFEIEGTREGLRAVDEVISKWVAWGEKAG